MSVARLVCDAAGRHGIFEESGCACLTLRLGNDGTDYLGEFAHSALGVCAAGLGLVGAVGRHSLERARWTYFALGLGG